jgi:uncharacterized protein YbjT (DUF2867 family)
MQLILFGATGMIGRGVLKEALADAEVERVLAIGRAATGVSHPKLTERVMSDPGRLDELAGELTGFDACLFCLGVSAVGMSEAAYRDITYALSLKVAEQLLAIEPKLAFLYVSGGGTNANSRTMWARVKGETENALLALPFRQVVMFRPGFIQPLDGIRSRTRLYNVLYTLTRPLLPLLRALFPRLVTTTRLLGRAMLTVAKHGAATPIVENGDINQIAKAS